MCGQNIRAYYLLFKLGSSKPCMERELIKRTFICYLKLFKSKNWKMNSILRWWKWRTEGNSKKDIDFKLKNEKKKEILFKEGWEWSWMKISSKENSLNWNRDFSCILRIQSLTQKLFQYLLKKNQEKTENLGWHSRRFFRIKVFHK